MISSLLLAAALSLSPSDRLLTAETLSCREWAEIANAYMAMGQQKATEDLIVKSRKPPVYHSNSRTCFVARLIFEPKQISHLRDPGLGPRASQFQFLSEVNYLSQTDWPAFPFVEQDGVLFLLQERPQASGRPEPCKMYLDYCARFRQFRKTPYKIPTSDQAKAALEVLYQSDRWKKLRWPDTDTLRNFKNFLEKQFPQAE